MKPADWFAFVLLSALWGASFLFIRVAAPAFGPAFLMDVRVWLAGLSMLLFTTLTGKRISFRGRVKSLLLLGALNAGVPFTLIAAAELEIPASLTAMIIGTTPMLTAVAASLLGEEEMTFGKTVALLAGLAGVGVLVGWTPIPLTFDSLLAAGVAFLAACCYALGGIYVSRKFQGVPALTMAIGQQLGAGVILLPLALFRLPRAAPPAEAVWALLALTFFSTVLAYLCYFRLIRNAGPTTTLSVNFLIPVFSLVGGVLWLGETVGWGTWVGLALVSLSLMFVTKSGDGGRRKSGTEKRALLR